MALPIGLQLYTLRDQLSDDFEGTLRQVAEIGYRYVEFPSLFDHSPEDVRKICDDLELTIFSEMCGIAQLRDNLSQCIKSAEILGNGFIVCPYLDASFQNPPGYRQAAQILNDAGKTLFENGLQLCHHNHAFEFDKLPDSPCGFDIIFDETNPQWVKSELDVYWVHYAGNDPLAFMQKFTGRLPLLHIKDMTEGEEKNFTEVGSGVIDMKTIVKNAQDCGVEYLIIEQDSNWSPSPIDSVRTSYNALNRINS